MARDIRRKHLATDEFLKRKNTRRRLRTMDERGGKTAKAARTGQRVALRREYR